MIPSRKPATNRVQLNKLFDSIDEMNNYVAANHKGATVVKTWSVKHICCEIEMPDKTRKVGE